MSTHPNEAEEVIAYEPNCELRREIGTEFKLGSVITDAQIDACEVLLEKAADEFFADAAPDLAAMMAMIPASWPGEDYEHLLTHTYNIKSHAKVLGFTLITDVCMHIVSTVHSQKLATQKKQALLAQLIGTLKLTFDKQLRSDGGAFGRELRAQLQRSI